MAEPKNIIGAQLRRLRYKRALSQPSLAVKCQLLGWDIARDTIAKIEGQTRWVGDKELVLLARALDVPIVELLPPAIRKTLRKSSGSAERRILHATFSAGFQNPTSHMVCEVLRFAQNDALWN